MTDFKNNPAEPFLALSAILTGFERVDLLGTGLVETYYNEIAGIVGTTIGGELWSTTIDIIERCREDEPQLETAVRRQILASPKLGPIARNLIQLWYTGAWNELPQGWRDLYGAKPERYDQDHFARGLPERLGMGRHRRPSACSKTTRIRFVESAACFRPALIGERHYAGQTLRRCHRGRRHCRRYRRQDPDPSRPESLTPRGRLAGRNGF